MAEQSQPESGFGKDAGISTLSSLGAFRLLLGRLLRVTPEEIQDERQKPNNMIELENR